MPALPIHLFRRETYSQAARNNGGRVALSGTALGFLIPIFIFFIIGPIVLVLVTRNRRARRLATAEQRPARPGLRARALLKGKPVKISRDVAKRELKGVTEAVSLEVDGAVGEKRRCEPEMEKVEGLGDAVKVEDAGSVFEPECAICLSTLHAPSPPEAAALPTPSTSPETAAIDDTAAATHAPSISEAEEILRLNVCSHEFHAECLTSWFVIGKFSCPICRAVYYSSVLKLEESGNAEVGTEGLGENGRRRQDV